MQDLTGVGVVLLPITPKRLFLDPRREDPLRLLEMKGATPGE
jgi:hypothetical protein